MSNTNVVIRKINGLDWEIFDLMSRKFYDEISLKFSDSNLRNTFAACLNESPYIEGLIFEYENEIAGFALLALSWSNEAGGVALWLDELFVLPEYRGKGVAGKLFLYMENNYNHFVKRCYLEVYKTNKVAFEIYTAKGFKASDSIFMLKDI